ncbi:hypothetical protein PBR20603_00883 [Pandoraea bronchicola]|uniref:Fe-S protein n=2 Tax=Pandoraea bronchicola TaxID=2508287 RepID=A0A5E5BM77_9BURK|nr:hypothetical protein PBR20603_00883 [Pandoraea bronchicola]
MAAGSAIGEIMAAPRDTDPPPAKFAPPMSELHDRPDSPCIGVCSTLFDDVCKGCGRTAYEVSNWVFFTDEEKAAVWARINREGTAMRFCDNGTTTSQT